MNTEQTVMKTKQALAQPQRVALLGGALTASAVTKTWVPTAGGSWATAGNWSPDGAPAAGDDVVISSDQSASITAVPTISLNSLTVNGNCPLAGATSGNRITITGTAASSFFVAAARTLTLGATPGARMNFTLAVSAQGTVNGTVI